MSELIVANLREMFVELAWKTQDQVQFFRSLNRKDQLTAGLADIFSGSSIATEAKPPLRVATDLERILVREEWGGKAALIVTEGFENLLEIGTGQRLQTPALKPAKQRSMIPHELCFGITERMRPDGTIELHLDEKEIEVILSKLKMSQITCVAVCLLHSKINPIHEKKLEEHLAKAGISTYCSHQFEGSELERATSAATEAISHDSKEALSKELEKLGFNLAAITHETLKPQRWRKSPIEVQAHFLVDRTLLHFFSGDQHKFHELRLSGLSHIALLDGGLVHVGPDNIDSEPGPVSFGKGLELCVLDAFVLLNHVDLKSVPRLKVDPSRLAKSFAVMAKHFKLSNEDLCKRFIELISFKIAEEIRTASILAKCDLKQAEFVILGPLGQSLGASVAEQLSVKTRIVPDYGQWSLLLTMLGENNLSQCTVRETGSLTSSGALDVG